MFYHLNWGGTSNRFEMRADLNWRSMRQADPILPGNSKRSVNDKLNCDVRPGSSVGSANSLPRGTPRAMFC
jgi:hypothetical protein